MANPDLQNMVFSMATNVLAVSCTRKQSKITGTSRDCSKLGPLFFQGGKK